MFDPFHPYLFYCLWFHVNAVKYGNHGNSSCCSNPLTTSHACIAHCCSRNCATS